MPAPVDLVTIHHEGAGTPSDDPRGAASGYTYWIGSTRYEHLRTVWSSYATLNFNHVSLDICLSGNRMDVPVTANDITLIRGAVTEARGLGYVVDAPYVRSHHDSPGSNTVCPGTFTREPLTWTAIVTACHKEAPPMPPTVPPQYFPGIGPFESWCETSLGVVGVKADGAVFAIPGSAYKGGANGKAYFAGRSAARITPGPAPHAYTITATSGETYAYP